MSDLENTKCNTVSPRRFPAARVWFAMAGVYYLGISMLSQISGQTLNQLPFSFWDKGAHFAVYGGLGCLLCLGFLQIFEGRIKAVVISLLVASILGCLDEVHQMFVPGRFAGLDDVAADALGALVGAGMGVLAVGIYFRKREKAGASAVSLRPS